MISAGHLTHVARRAREARSMNDRLDQALRLYRWRIGRCHTINQINRVHIAIENYMTPAEVRHFATGLAEDAADSESRRWITKLGAVMPFNRSRQVEFERKGIFKGATRYTADTGTADGKTLIIGFAGHWHRLMLPTPWLLDCLNPALYDVVVLRDFTRLHYALGIPGLGGDFVEALTNLRRHVDPRAYRNAIALGTSGGGLPAVMASILLELDRGIAICGQGPARVAAKLQTHGLRIEPYAALLASRPDRFPELILTYGGDHKVDAASSNAIHAVVPSELRPVKKCSHHEVLAWHLARGTFPHYLSKLLDQGLESRDLWAAPLVGGIAMGPNADSQPHPPSANHGASSHDPRPMGEIDPVDSKVNRHEH